MKKTFKAILLMIFSLLIIGATPHDTKAVFNRFDYIEKEINDKYEFLENGVKIQYCSYQTLEEEYIRLIKKLEEYNYCDVELGNNRIIYKDNNIEISIVLWSERDSVKVEIICINRSSSKPSSIVKTELNKLVDDNGTDIKYFTFFKYKVLESQKDIVNKLLEENFKTSTVELLDIYNGNVVKATLKDNQKVNLGFVKYDTGEHLFIGTPVIFVEY